ncbi:hypothetical protein [Caballeronia sp. GAWG1-5s-s]|uniref:hypothetical protein n=1 Tax=Caballeronia sp. GAWG1-5s-s TaxID=2921743 RepID=UPI002028574A|nr:hypothetical protein [Caballeronia sp. GAWG1-5s-s]
MTRVIIGILFLIVLCAGCYALAHGDGPMTYFMDDDSLLSQCLCEQQALLTPGSPT